MKPKFLLYLLFALSLFLACEPDHDNNNTVDREASRIRGNIYTQMQISYYWTDKLPTNVDTTADISPEQFFYSLLYRALDRWSFFATKDQLNDLEKGIFYGHGIMFTYDEYANIRVGYVYKNTKAYTSGIQRGWILKKINDREVYSYTQLDELIGEGNFKVTNTFLFIDNEGKEQTINIEKESITINPVLADTILQIGSKKIGYLALESFLGDDIEGKLDEIFSKFNTNAIDELIIDLRYNTGGSLATANHLANLIIGHRADKELFIKLTFNQILEDFFPDSIKNSYIEKKTNSLTQPLSRVFLITSGQTASASEALIKGLQPYLPTYLIGTRTYGKPVGMIPLNIKKSEYVIVPVMFEWKNAQEESSGYAGIGVN